MGEEASEEVKLRMDLLKSLTLVFREMDSTEVPEEPCVTAAVSYVCVCARTHICTCVLVMYVSREMYSTEVHEQPRVTAVRCVYVCVCVHIYARVCGHVYFPRNGQHGST